MIAVLFLIILILAIILITVVVKGHKPKIIQTDVGVLEQEVQTKRKELEILNKKKQLMEDINQADQALQKEKDPQ